MDELSQSYITLRGSDEYPVEGRVYGSEGRRGIDWDFFYIIGDRPITQIFEGMGRVLTLLEEAYQGFEGVLRYNHGVSSFMDIGIGGKDSLSIVYITGTICLGNHLGITIEGPEEALIGVGGRWFGTPVLIPDEETLHLYPLSSGNMGLYRYLYRLCIINNKKVISCVLYQEGYWSSFWWES